MEQNVRFLSRRRSKIPPDLVVTLSKEGEREYRLLRDLGVLTVTPHVEEGGHDVSRRMGYSDPMDQRTQALYDTLKQIYNCAGCTVEDLTIFPLCVQVRKTAESGWPDEAAEEALIECLRRHLGYFLTVDQV